MYDPVKQGTSEQGSSPCTLEISEQKSTLQTSISISSANYN